MVPLQQERTLQSCHFCPSWPASNCSEHLTLGPRHCHLGTVNIWEQRSHVQAIDLGLEIRWECQHWKPRHTLMHWYNDAAYISVWCENKNNSLFIVGHVFNGFSAQPNYNAEIMNMQLWHQTQSCIIQTMNNRFTMIWSNNSNRALFCSESLLKYC